MREEVKPRQKGVVAALGIAAAPALGYQSSACALPGSLNNLLRLTSGAWKRALRGGSGIGGIGQGAAVTWDTPMGYV